MFFFLSLSSSSSFFLPLFFSQTSYYRGRGAFESLGAGLSMEPGDIAFKCNFATLEEEKEEEKEEKGGQKSGRRGGGEEATPTPPLVVSRRADRAFEAAGPVFCSALDGLRLPSFPWIEVRVKYATEHRAGVVLSMRKQEKTEEEASETSTWTSTSTSPSTSIGNGDEGKRPPPPLFELSDAVSGTDPLKDNLPLRRCVSLLSSSDGEGEEGLGGNGDSEEEMKKRKKDAETTAEIVNELSDEIRRVLESHPLNLERRGQGKAVANALLLRGCGARAPLPDFATKFGFARGCAVAPTKIIAGLALCAGFEVLECARGTGDYRTSLRSKVDAVVGAIERADDEEERKRKSKEEEREEPSPSSSPSAPLFVLLHVKAVDDAGHDRAPFKKMAWLRAVDAALARLVRKLGSKRGEKGGGGSKSPEVVVAVTGDHSTPVEFGDHSCEPVPFAAAPLRAVVEALLLGKNEDEEGGGGEKEGGGEEEIVAPTEEEMRRVVAAAKDKKKRTTHRRLCRSMRPRPPSGAWGGSRARRSCLCW